MTTTPRALASGRHERTKIVRPSPTSRRSSWAFWSCVWVIDSSWSCVWVMGSSLFAGGVGYDARHLERQVKHRDVAGLERDRMRADASSHRLFEVRRDAAIAVRDDEPRRFGPPPRGPGNPRPRGTGTRALCYGP